MKVRVNARSPWGLPGDEPEIEDSSVVQHHLSKGTLTLLDEPVIIDTPPVEVEPVDDPPVEEPVNDNDTPKADEEPKPKPKRGAKAPVVVEDDGADDSD